MNKNIIEKFEHKNVKLILNNTGFVLYGYINAVFDDCIEFKTKQKVSYIEFIAIAGIEPPGDQ